MSRLGSTIVLLFAACFNATYQNPASTRLLHCLQLATRYLPWKIHVHNLQQCAGRLIRTYARRGYQVPGIVYRVPSTLIPKCQMPNAMPCPCVLGSRHLLVRMSALPLKRQISVKAVTHQRSLAEITYTYNASRIIRRKTKKKREKRVRSTKDDAKKGPARREERNERRKQMILKMI